MKQHFTKKIKGQRKRGEVLEKYDIAVGESRTEKIWKNTTVTWKQFTERLKTTTRTAESQGEYKNMTKAKQDALKDVGGFIGGKLKQGHRKRSCVEYRSLLTLDIDFAKSDFCENLDLFLGSTYCIYSTHKHTPEKPRLRLVIPLSRNCTPEEYEAVARQIAYDIGIDMFDDTTYQPHRLMYWPSTSLDGEYIFIEETRKPLDVDETLLKYENWKDVTQWHYSSKTVKKRKTLIQKQQNPTEKSGIVGAFCKAYTVDSVIETFLYNVYEKCAIEGRYTYCEGSTGAGAVVYEDGLFLYSNHATDPAGGILCNAFDLMRIHKFIQLDEEAEEGTPTVKLPSYKAMEEFASKDDEVKKVLHKERMAEIAKDFEGLETDEQENMDWTLTLEIDSKGRVASTIDNIKKILENDMALKKKIKLNEFTKKYKVFDGVPWEKEKQERNWTDNDDAGLRHYLEKAYDIKGKSNIEDAWSLVANENKYHPVRDYLNSLDWDGQKRLETFFIDYLGAENNNYVKEVTKKAIVAGVARIYVPGIKYDNLLVLIGAQGCGKSQSIKKLAKKWFSDTLCTIQGKEAYEQIQGFWIIEIAELAAMKKMEIEAIKHFITKSEDAYRAAYGRHVEIYQRQCVFFGTTNKYEFLKDTTGNRRFWPIDVFPERASKNLWKDLTDEEVDQIWAEAVELFRKGEKLYLDEDIKYMAEQEQDRHLEESPLTGDILMYLDKKLPENWENYDLSKRRAYIHGTDFGKAEEGTVERQKVCPLEIWCELFQGDKKDFNITKSKEIKDVILKTGEWGQEAKRLRFGDLYGTQRGFIREI